MPNTCTLYTHIASLFQPLPHAGHNRHPAHVHRNAVMLVKEGRVVHIGTEQDIPALDAQHHPIHVSLQNCAVLPGFVDAHTHTLFAGARIHDMDLRSQGKHYTDIQNAGGGIYSTVQQVVEASDKTLIQQTQARLRQMLQSGTTTCEIKTGYGLQPSEEMRLLGLIQQLKKHTPIQLFSTALAHVPPASYASKRETYLDVFYTQVIEPAYAQHLIDFADVYIDSSAFPTDVAKIFLQRVRNLGVPIKTHAEQWRSDGGGALSAHVQALSADHLEHCTPHTMQLLAQHNVVATVLPGCVFFLGKGPWPPARALRDAGCDVAIATDCNPGSSMLTSLPLCATLAATHCGLTVNEALWGITQGGAKALGLTDRGALQPSQRADFVVLNQADYRAVLYETPYPPIQHVYIHGEKVV
jgi:imidazolonepropionase